MTRDEFMKLPKHLRPKLPFEVLTDWALKTREEWGEVLTAEGWHRVYTMDEFDVGESEGWRRKVGDKVEWFEVSFWDFENPGTPPERCWYGNPSPRDPRICAVYDSDDEAA